MKTPTGKVSYDLLLAAYHTLLQNFRPVCLSESPTLTEYTLLAWAVDDSGITIYLHQMKGNHHGNQ